MRSIRSRLTLGLLVGLALLWLGTGIGVYVVVRQSLLKSVDAELEIDARSFRFVSRLSEREPSGRGGRLKDRLADYRAESGRSFFQVWDREGEVMERSESLGELVLSFPDASWRDNAYRLGELPDGRPVRMLLVPLSESSGKGFGKPKGKGRGRPETHPTVLAKDLEDVERTLSSLLGGLLIAGVAGSVATVLLVGGVLRRGLRPLAQLGKESQSIDASSLDARFESENPPAELQPVYAALNELLDRLETGFERERRFSSDLAHEMRTPVAELKMMSEVALKWPEESSPDQSAQTLQIAQELESLIDSMLTLARWESGQASLTVEAVNLAPLIKQCWEPLRPRAEARGLEVTMEVDDGEWLTDVGVMRVVINNLLSNAVDYTPEGGRVWIRGNGDEWTVANEAPELHEGQVERLFERFWRADGARSDTAHSGLGLTMARDGAAVLGCDLTAGLQAGVLTFRVKKR